ncbi:MAG: hypothetical protein WBB36_13705 [Chitinophagales bacterium]
MASQIPFSSWLMLFLTLGCLAVIFSGLHTVLKRSGMEKSRQRKYFLLSLLVVDLWILLLGLLSWNGFFTDFSVLPPRPLLAVLLPLPVMLMIAFSKQGTLLLKLTPPHWLIFIQTFRIAVELVLWMAFFQQLLPVQMTFEGRNFDVLSGLLAFPVGYFCFVKKNQPVRFVLFYNILGLLLLFNILIIAALSMPTPFRYFMNEPANTIVATFPFIYLPGILVPIAYSFHIFSLRQLWLSKNFR